MHAGRCFVGFWILSLSPGQHLVCELQLILWQHCGTLANAVEILGLAGNFRPHRVILLS
jgi:hypothetical protein